MIWIFLLNSKVIKSDGILLQIRAQNLIQESWVATDMTDIIAREKKFRAKRAHNFGLLTGAPKTLHAQDKGAPYMLQRVGGGTQIKRNYGSTK